MIGLGAYMINSRSDYCMNGHIQTKIWVPADEENDFPGYWAVNCPQCVENIEELEKFLASEKNI